jgi:hypothetical protein
MEPLTLPAGSSAPAGDALSTAEREELKKLRRLAAEKPQPSR